MVLQLFIYQICNKKNLTNQKPPLWSCDFWRRLLIGPIFFIADLAYLSNSKTFLPLVKLSSGHYFNIFSSENPLLMPIGPIFFHGSTRNFPKWRFLKRKILILDEYLSYGVKNSNFELLISHWWKLSAQWPIWPCDGYGQSFPKWYNTWWSAKKWGGEGIFCKIWNFWKKRFKN